MALGRANPSIPRKFGLGLLFNGAAFALLMYALSQMVVDGKIPFWTLFMVYVIQSVGELCLSPIGLSMVTKLAPVRLVGFGMGGWFLSTGIGNNLSGIFAGVVSGEGGMTVESALKGYTFGFWALIGSGVVLFLVAPLIHGGENSLRFTPHFGMDSEELDLLVGMVGRALREGPRREQAAAA